MPIEAENSIETSWRIGLWFASLLVAVTGLALCMAGPRIGNFPDFEDTFSAVFLAAMVYAVPVACLFLPLIIAFKDVSGWRLWTLLSSGALAGPIAIALFAHVSMLLHGEKNDEIMMGDPLGGIGGIASSFMLFALIVGSTATILYIAALRILSWRARRFSAESHPTAA